MAFRFVLFFETQFRNHPIAIAATAGVSGLVCGALIVALLARPSVADVAGAKTKTTETAGVSTLSNVETNPLVVVAKPGTPIRNETVVPANCEQQGWPYITQKCLTERDPGQRKVRVISTDKLAAPMVSAIESRRASEKPNAVASKSESAKTAPAKTTVTPVFATPTNTSPSASATAESPVNDRAAEDTASIVLAVDERGETPWERRKRKAISRSAPSADRNSFPGQVELHRVY